MQGYTQGASDGEYWLTPSSFSLTMLFMPKFAAALDLLALAETHMPVVRRVPLPNRPAEPPRLLALTPPPQAGSGVAPCPARTTRPAAPHGAASRPQLATCEAYSARLFFPALSYFAEYACADQALRPRLGWTDRLRWPFGNQAPAHTSMLCQLWANAAAPGTDAL